jgi:hypothetical protein
VLIAFVRALEHQLGAEYADRKDFRKKLKATLRKVREVLPTLQVEMNEAGLFVLPASRPAVPRTMG